MTDKMLRIHGLHPSNFDVIANAERLMEENINDVSIDDNSNKNEKTIKGIMQEAKMSFDKIVGYRYLYRQLKEDYGKDRANLLCGLMYDLSIGLSDSSNILVPYCWAADASKLVTIGRDFGQLKSAPAKYLHSYVSSLSETVHELSSHLAGAIAVGSFFLDVAHILLIKERTDLNNKKSRKYIENEFQHFVHNVNHLSRNGIETPFSNVSIFDRAKLDALLDDYAWYFDPISQQENWKQYVIEYIIEVQDIYLEFVDAGDPMTDGIPYRFPVNTINISKNDKNEFLDPEFLDRILELDILKYNIFISEGTKTASCCFDGKQEVFIMLPNDSIRRYTFDDLQKVNNLGLTSSLRAYNGEEWDVFDFVEVPYNKDYFVIETADMKILKATNNHIHPIARYNTTEKGLSCNYMEVSSSELIVGDYLQCLTKDFYSDGKTSKYETRITKISRAFGSKTAFCLNMKGFKPYFLLANEVYTHNCRLLSDNEMLDLASQSNSFGGGGSSSLGSHRVATINLHRIALEYSDDILEAIDDKVFECVQILASHKKMIQHFADNGMHKFISNGWINMKRMFSTVGLLGLYEMKEELDKLELYQDVDIIEEALRVINDALMKYSKMYGIIGNIEQIPAESFAIRLAKANKIIYGEDAVPYEMYSNQFVPLWVDATVNERIEIDGKYNKLITGGGIVHINVGEKLTKTQKREIIEKACKSGCEHFAINGVYSQFEDGNVLIGKYNEHPETKSKMIEQYTRVVGFFTPVGSWNKTRREWEFDKRVVYDVDEL